MLRVDDTYIDLYDNQPVNLKYQYSDISEVQTAVGSFSQSFRIPATENNRGVFGQFQNTNEVNGFNPKERVDAFLFYDTVPIMTGFVQLKKATIRNGKHTEFEIVFFGETVDLAKKLGNQKLKDLDLSDYDHTLNYTNVTGSWTNSLFSGGVRYGLIDSGNNWGQNGGQNAITSDNPLRSQDFNPFLRVPIIVQEILEQNGFTVEGSFSDTTFNNYYTPFGNTFPSDNVLGVGIDTDNQFISNGGIEDYTFTNWSDTLSSFYDPQGEFDPVTGLLTPSVTGNYTLNLYSTVVSDPANSGGATVVLKLYRNSDNTPVYVSPSQDIAVGGGYTFNETPTLLLDSSESYYLGLTFFAINGDVFDMDFANSIFPNGGGTGITFLDAPFPVTTVNLSDVAPDITQIDYLTSLGKMFNLVFIPSRLDPSIIEIETYSTYHTGGTVKDWTEKLDLSKDIVIEPTTDLQKKVYEWTYSSSKDFTNKFYEDNAKRIYGRYKIEETTNDFSTGELKIQPKFGAYPCSFIAGTNVLIYKSINEQGVAVEEPLTNVVYWGGLQDMTVSLPYYNDVTEANVDLTQYPYFGHYSAPYPDADDIDLNYGGEQPPHPIIANPTDNLYETYWRDYVNELYSDEARLMTAHFKLDAIDLAGFEWSDNIWIKDSYWRILEIDYSPNSETVTKVKLIKILATIRACEWIPFAGNADGTITFIDSNGVQGDPTQGCCEYFGYVYVDGSCYANGFTGGISPIPLGNQIGLANADNGGNFYGNGSNVSTAVGSSGFTTGQNISIGASARNVFVGGEWIDINQPNTQAFGSNTNAFVRGFHRGGGWWYENFLTGDKGQQQYGEIVFSFEGDFDSTDEVELFIEGIQNERLSIPSHSSMGCRFDVMVTTYNAATQEVSNVEYLTYYDILEKSSAGVASSFYSSHNNNPTIQFGDFGGGNKFHLDIDTTTDTSQHRIILHNQSTSNTENTRIVCVLNYLMATK